MFVIILLSSISFYYYLYEFRLKLFYKYFKGIKNNNNKKLAEGSRSNNLFETGVIDKGNNPWIKIVINFKLCIKSSEKMNRTKIDHL